jgi:GTP cyclohydrolase I
MNRKGRAGLMRAEERTRMEPQVRAILEALGEDPSREGLVKTPTRVARALQYLTSGYEQDPKAVINGALFVEDYSEMILCRDIDFFSLCEHHLLPFFGKAQLAYIPKNHIIGISKLARLVEVFARRLQVQERMTTQIASTLMEELDPLGVGVVLKAEHLCMRMRGVEKQNSTVVTSAMLGSFRTHQATRQEFMTLLHTEKD